MSKKYPVIAECVDARTGKRYFPGDTFPDPSDEQLARLVNAGCLKDSPVKQAKAEAADKAAADKAAAEKKD